MGNLLLLAAIGGLFLFGWFLMGKLDRALEENRRALEREYQSDLDALQVKFSGRTDAGEIKQNAAFCPEYIDLLANMHYNNREEALPNILWTKSVKSS